MTALVLLALLTAVVLTAGLVKAEPRENYEDDE